MQHQKLLSPPTSKSYVGRHLISSFLMIIILVPFAFVTSQAAEAVDAKGFRSLQRSGEQNIRVSGKVVSDDDREGMPGVNVIVKETSIGTVTNIDGDFSIEVSGQDAILVFSSVGYITQEIIVGNQTEINVTLASDVRALDELVVVGYGTQKKRDITGSISSVSGEELNETISSNFVQALQGRTAGVFVNSNSGQPGGGVSVRIRGIGGLNNSEPLYVVDGVQMSGGGSDYYNPLASINPNDIESIEVLKDASSAAIYGARAANGVVLITTKRGKSGKPRLNYSGSFGVQNLTNPNHFDLLNAREFATVVNQTVVGDGGVPIFGANTEQYPLELFPAPDALGVGTDWMDEVFVDNASIQDHQFSISGGNEAHKYFLSLNYFDQDGTMLGTKFKRYSIRLNTDNNLTDNIIVGNSLLISHNNSNTLQAVRNGVGGILYNTLVAPPTIPVYNEDGSFAGPPTSFYQPRRTPVASILDPTREARRTELIGNVYGQVNFLKDFSFKTSFSLNMGSDKNEQYTPTYDEGINSSSITSLSSSNSTSSTWIYSNVLSYNKDIKEHHISAMAGMESQEHQSDFLQGTARYTDDAIKVVSSEGSEVATVDQSKSASSLLSYFGRVAYNYAAKYYIEGNIRRDGSSKFGRNSRWGVFPSVSGAYRISNEDFFPDNAVVNGLKLRVSYGKVGSDRIGDFRYIAGLRNVFYAFGNTNGSFANGLAIDELGNPDLKWETSEQINYGIDAEFFDSKLLLTAEYYETNVSDMLLGLPIPAITGISASVGEITLGEIISNAGSLTNKGFELEVEYRNHVGDFNYSVGGNLTTFNNKVTDIGRNEQIWGMSIDGNNVSRTVVGGSLGEFYGYVVEGIFQTQEEVDAANALGEEDMPYQDPNTAPGDFRYKDLDGDNVITAADRDVIGSPIPDFTYGLNMNLAYKNFDLSLLLTGSQGNEIYNANRRNLEASGQTNFNKSKTVLDAWSGPNTSNTIPRRIASDPNLNKRVSSVFVEDGSYMTLRNVQINYHLPMELISRISLSDAMVYLSGQRLFTFTKYSGFDPIVGNNGGSNLNAGIDNDLYPQAKSVHLGLQISF
ncbi:TonB-linked SusC/RagA family outer membrane protein [Catalinimonas alkaloidigena]|nr:TonB-linked SusC/RagA family outer membrane protein [Catalinimonas alkaloidigena]